MVTYIMNHFNKPKTTIQEPKMKKKAIIIGAGPAGLTAALELLEKTDIIPIIFETTSDIGGISKTVNYKGNRIDIGGHRFFSKSDKIMNWWLNILPLENPPELDAQTRDDIMLVRSRLSRILFLRKFFDYPITLSWNTISNLGFVRMCKIGLSYIKSSIFQRREKSLEDFFINRFGEELYSTFFKDYTQKVWGVPCSQIKPEWGAQRIKGLSVAKTISNAILKPFTKHDLSQKNQETSLIEQFMYPKLGPGYMWEKAAQIVKSKGGEIYFNQKIVEINSDGNQIISVTAENTQTGETIEHNADYFISTMPVRELILGNKTAPEDIREVAEGLKYRDFMTVGLLLDKLKIGAIPDNWIYVQENDVKLGRIQVFNNWSPYLVENQDNTWLGLEYFCNEGDELWNMADADFSDFAVKELEKIGVIDKADVLDSVVIRMPKAYPAYFGSYENFDKIRDFVDKIENLFLIGRNGMHRYNNMDHSMLSAMQAVENISNGTITKQNIWEVNAEEEYHEKK